MPDLTAAIAFLGKPAVQAKYVNRAEMHHKLDQIIQGEYWDGSHERTSCWSYSCPRLSRRCLMPDSVPAVPVMTEKHEKTLATMIESVRATGLSGTFPAIERNLHEIRSLVSSLASGTHAVISVEEVKEWKRMYERDTEFPPHNTAYDRICRWLSDTPPSDREGE